MTRILTALLGAFFLCAALPGAPARAQSQQAEEVVWVQIEARPSLSSATDRAKAYATLLQDVNGFGIGGGWYAVALGPYTRSDAQIVLDRYKRDGLIPRDSFIQFTSRLRQQFWPVGANILGGSAAEPPAQTQTPAPQAQTQTEPSTQAAVAEPIAPDETPAEARRSERSLSRDERKELQVALKWAGFYTSAIDGAFGRGTRRSMSAWQEANGFEVTGILTTMQRAELFRQYNAVLEGMDLRLVSDAQAGVEMALPRGVVAFDRYEPPFAHYEPTGFVDGAKVLLISQPGDQATLFGLYEIMQTLDIVPLEGPRQRNTRSFTLEGRDGQKVSYTEARLEGGAIKGFTLIWPAGDEERRTRVLGEMQKSFRTFDAVLSPSAGQASEQSIDLVAGLAVRKPKLSRSGFFVTTDGVVATTSEAVQSCGRITLDGETEADLLSSDAALGLAFVKPRTGLAPRAIASLETVEPRLQSELAAAGYSFEGVLSAPSLNFGTLADVKGLRGEPELSRLELRAQPGDAGGPVLDLSGAVVGMLMPRPEGGPQLPDDVNFALDAERLVAAGAAAGLGLTPAEPTGVLSSVKIAERATGMTVLVSCWE